MAFTLDTKARIPTTANTTSAANPVSGSYTCGAGTDVLVVCLIYAAGTRTGTVTFNSINLTQADTAHKGTTSPEAYCEIWYLLHPPTGSAYTLSIPNANTLAMAVHVMSFVPTSGKQAGYDTAHGVDNATGTNPSDSITRGAQPNVVVGVVADGAQAWTGASYTGQTGTVGYNDDNGSWGGGSQYLFTSATGAQSMSWTFSVSEDNGVVLVSFADVSPVWSETAAPALASATTDTVVLSVTRAVVAASTLASATTDTATLVTAATHNMTASVTLASATTNTATLTVPSGAAPHNGVLDNFNRSDADTLGASWGNSFATSGRSWRIVSNHAEPNIPLSLNVPAEAASWTTSGTNLQYHNIVTDDANGAIVPWYSPGNRGASYDHVIRQVFEWWLTIPTYGPDPDYDYYLMHMVWNSGHTGDALHGLGGDQLQMALSSWRLLYAYWGDSRIVTNMTNIADYYLAHSLSASTDDWPYLPYPYQTGADLTVYSGDMIADVGYTQPDKAGSFGYELVNLYKMTGTSGYLTAAVNIANTLAAKINAGSGGDATHSPIPFRINAITGAGTGNSADDFTSNYTPTLRLWADLTTLGQGNTSAYATAKTTVINWLKTYVVAANRYGNFFEDVSEYSDTAINAGTLAMYILEQGTNWGTYWATDARRCLDWAWSELGNTTWSAYGVTVMNEQTTYRSPGQSHTSRQAAMELFYAEKTGDGSRIANAVHALNWATYTVNTDGENTYFTAGTWLTDGYGDYVRHYLRAIAAIPSLAPSTQDHILRTSSVVKSVTYSAGSVSYETYNADAIEKLNIKTFTPSSVTAGGTALTHRDHISDLDSQSGWTYGAPGDLANVLRIHHTASGVIVVS